MNRSNSSTQAPTHGLRKLQQLLARVKATMQSKEDLVFFNKYKCDYEISQPLLMRGGQLKKYQLEALEWMIGLADMKSNGILADDMGLGKTIQAISYLAYLKEEHGILGKHLIVCPKSVAGNWERQIKKWFPSARVALMITNVQTRQKFLNEVVRPKKFDIIVVNYQGAKIAGNTLARIKWQTLIIDQAHKIKNNMSSNFIFLNTLSATFRLLLTGTPLNNNLKELWCLLNFIMPELFTDEHLFDEIEEEVNLFKGTEEEKLQHQCEVAKVFHEIIQPFFKRRTKKELDLGLHEKTEMTLFVPMSQLQLRLYRNFLRYGSVYGPNHPANYNIMVPRKICQHPFLFPNICEELDQDEEALVESCGKLGVLDKLLKKLIAEKHKTLVFSQFTMALDVLEDFCRLREYKFCRIDGNIDLEQRDQMVKTFYEDEEYSIFLLSTRAGGLGLNLVAADRVVIYDIDWNPMNDLQAMDRAYRIGQTKPVTVYRLITEHSIEERMLQFQKCKLIWDDLVIQRGAVFARTKQDPFANINFSEFTKFGKGDIFHLEPDQNEQTIQQIIALGQAKNKKKEQQIRNKLKKSIEIGSKINPFLDQKEEQDYVDTKEYEDQFVFRRNYDNDKRERAKFDRNRQLPAFKFYIQHQMIKDIEFEIYMEEKREDNQRNQKLLEKLYEKLVDAQSKGYFHHWNQYQFEQFIKAHEIFHRTDYANIAAVIGSKTEEEVSTYSKHFFEKAPNNERLIDYLKQIQAYQSKLKKQQKESLPVSKEISNTIKPISPKDNSSSYEQPEDTESGKTEKKEVSKKKKASKELQQEREKIKMKREQEKLEKIKRREELIKTRMQSKAKKEEETRLRNIDKQKRLEERELKKQRELQEKERRRIEMEEKKKLQELEKQKREAEKTSKKEKVSKEKPEKDQAHMERLPIVTVSCK